MPRDTSKLFDMAVRSAVMTVCMAAALAGTHATVGQVSLARAAGESSSTPVEELRHETLHQRGESHLSVHVTWRSPNFELPIVSGRIEAIRALERFRDPSPLSGGQHSLRNGFGAPLLT